MLPPADLDAILAETRPLWEDLRGGRIFITGGTGFFGRWLLESFAHANRELDLGARAVVLTRNPDGFRAREPHLGDAAGIELAPGDICTFDFPAGTFTHAVHAATDAGNHRDAGEALRMVDVIVTGTRRTLEFCRAAGVRRFLLTSSGAVYGRQPDDMTHVPETFSGAPDCTTTDAAYGESKRLAELLCACFGQGSGLAAVIARCFAFVGPGLPLDGPFAIGNFLRDARAGGPVRVGGDGTPLRSYLYAADLMVWLWSLLFRGTPGRAYNVGSEKSLLVAQVAAAVAQAAGDGQPLEVTVAQPPGDALPSRYVPCTRRAREELGLRERVRLEEALIRTLAFLRGGS